MWSHPHGAPQGLSKQPFGPPSGHHVVSWGAFGRFLGGHQAFRTIWGAFGDALGCLWGRLGDPMATLGRPSGTPREVLGGIAGSQEEQFRGKDQQGRQAEPKGTPGEGKRVDPKLENQRFASTGAGFSQNCICRSKKALGAFGDALGGPRDALRGCWGRLGGSLGTPWGVKGTPWGAKRRVHPGNVKKGIRNTQKGLRRGVRTRGLQRKFLFRYI